ncbi:MAG: M20/M25/M40 family metallo-hydrolase, partial [Deltaproteobacteria bacterium]
MDRTRTKAFIDRMWDDSIVPTLMKYIEIPNKSPHFDEEWATRGKMDEAVDLIAGWCKDHALAGMNLEVVRLPGRTPLIFIEIPGASEETVLLYGHLDKQPEMTGWEPGLGPWTPVLRGSRLYGRGGADDGYAVFSALTALAALADQQIPRARAVVLIEACEESGSYDLPAYIEALADRIGTPSLVVCLDSGCGNYDQLWCTTSLRGIVMGALRVEILREGVHSGDASGIVPSSFRIARQLLSRLEEETTGKIRIEACHVAVPPERLAQARRAAEALREETWNKFPFVTGAKPVTEDPTELVLN